MSDDVHVRIVDREGSRSVASSAFPISIGGAGGAIAVDNEGAGAPLAWIGRSGPDLFVQPADGAAVTCNGAVLATSQWLRPGDVVRAGGTRIVMESDGDGVVLRVDADRTDEDTEPPVAVISRTAPAAGDGEIGAPVAPVAFRPREARGGAARRRRIRPWAVVLWLGLAALGVAAWFVLTGRAVVVRVEPAPDRLEVGGLLSDFEFGGRRLLRPGRYPIEADREGYAPLRAEFEVTKGRGQEIVFTLERLPGFLVIETAIEGARVFVDGDPAGETPIEPIQLAAGEHDVRVEAERYAPFVGSVTIEGSGSRTVLEPVLAETWGTVTFRTSPPGAEVRVDGGRIGSTPVRADIAAGRHRVEYRLAGHQGLFDRFEVAAGQTLALAEVTLEPSDGRLRVVSDPPGAIVTIDGTYRGTAPMDLSVEPGERHEVELTLTGYEPASRVVTVSPDGEETLSVAMVARMGEVRFETVPEDAELIIDGEPRGNANQVVQLIAVPHRIEIRRDGYESVVTTVTPQPGYPESIETALRTPEQIQAEKTPDRIENPAGQEMVLIRGGRFRMGAPRREPGRRANETIREIELTRPYYLATTEVTNAQYRAFDAEHFSGTVGSKTLALKSQPVVRVTWEDAARYCNWLSAKADLQNVYLESGGRIVGMRPMSNGYRLPTEAEWAWAARFGGGTVEARKYPWGDALPAVDESGNYADESGAAMIDDTIEGFEDGYPVTAPVDAYDPGPLGIHSLGGNVSEWVHDLYSIYPSRTGEVEVDPLGPEDGELHVIRGASWTDSSVSELRLTYRDYGANPRADVGFRVARYAE